MGAERYKLKESAENFTVVDGNLSGRKYEHGITYIEIPPGEASRFDSLSDNSTLNIKNSTLASSSEAEGGDA